MSSDLPESLDDLFPQIASMSDNDKMLKLARHMRCDQCDCQGWRPNFSMEFSNDCLCGHDTEHHVDHKQDFMRRLKVALRIDELLQVNGALLSDCFGPRWLDDRNANMETNWTLA